MADTTITYNGKTTTVKTGKTATLPCDKKLMKSNVVVVAGGGVEVNGTRQIGADELNTNVNVSTYAYAYVNIPYFNPTGKVTIS